MKPSQVRDIEALFSDYRSEWSASVFSELFIVPPYFAKLEVRRPCFLVGGRGTGKTTALKSLRFDASEARRQQDLLPGGAIPYYGLYIRINKNRVRAFQGPGLSDEEWSKAFAHYFNLLFASEVCRLVAWLESRPDAPKVDFSAAAAALNCGDATTTTALLARVEAAIIALELYVNNPRHAQRPIMSMAEAPVPHLVNALTATVLSNNRLIFCCIDEYENLLDTQQGVINTYVKHCESPLSYKIGVKKGGPRSVATIDNADALTTPDDYALIDISQESFDLFARQVVEHRLRLAKDRDLLVADTLDEFLPELPFSTEASALGCGKVAEKVMDDLLASEDHDLVKWARAVPKSELYFLQYWSEGEGTSVTELAREWKHAPTIWETRLGNYGYASLFWLSKGRKGARIRKYYAGARTLTLLASGNIRYFIELIDEALTLTASDADAEAQWTGAVQPGEQTLAARAVGKRRLDQMERLSEKGSEIKRLVLGVGKVFFEFARDPVGRSPERNSFVLVGDGEARTQLIALLNEGVSNLAFEATPRTKATTQGEVRDDEYRIHPIFAPFFEYSHRRKRRVAFPAETLLELIEQPGRALLELLGRAPTPVDDVPEQLALFSSFYDSKDEEV